ncbi:hypothetical protein B0H16DRAFT_1474858 [Mycena metata]|uniref:Uncharacterized protein n=1 Tax=Mycena metata TaxID=1033252 RepID=A0AAD7HFK2_9AGAR|nr:hypothetical protein B0H16DRAFT_1474858 [Mycena metata]
MSREERASAEVCRGSKHTSCISGEITSAIFRLGASEHLPGTRLNEKIFGINGQVHISEIGALSSRIATSSPKSDAVRCRRRERSGCRGSQWGGRWQVKIIRGKAGARDPRYGADANLRGARVWLQKAVGTRNRQSAVAPCWFLTTKMSRIRRRGSYTTTTKKPKPKSEMTVKNMDQIDALTSSTSEVNNSKLRHRLATGLFVVDKWWIFNGSLVIKKATPTNSLAAAPAQNDLDDSTCHTRFKLNGLCFSTFPGASPPLLVYLLPGTTRKRAVSHPGRTPSNSTLSALLQIGFNRKCERRERKGLLSTRRAHVSTYSTTSTWIYILFLLSPPSPSLVSVPPAPPHLALLPMHRRRTDSTLNPSTPSPGERATAACAYPAASRLYAGIVSPSLTKGRQIHTCCPPWRARTSPNLIHTSPPAPFLSPPSLSLDLRLRTRPCYRAPPLLVPASTPAPSSRLEVVPAPALKRSVGISSINIENAEDAKLTWSGEFHGINIERVECRKLAGLETPRNQVVNENQVGFNRAQGTAAEFGRTKRRPVEIELKLLKLEGIGKEVSAEELTKIMRVLERIEGLGTYEILGLFALKTQSLGSRRMRDYGN